MKPNNPFLIKGYVSPEYFCDREQETRELTRALTNGQNVTLYSLRRMGKTGLLQHVGHLLGQKKNVQFIYTDIFSCEHAKDMALKMGNSLLQQHTQPKKLGEWLGDVFRSVKPVLGFDPITGAPELSVDMITQKQGLKTLDDIFAYLKRQKKHIVWAIDEFQQIVQFPEKNMEAVLRTHIQQLPHVQFVFSGSRKDMLFSMFNNTKRPFYHSTQMMSLDEIDEAIYRNFITRHFKKGKKKLSGDALDSIMFFSKGHTWYVQILCNNLYALPQSNITKKHVEEIMDRLIRQFEPLYFNYRGMLTDLQWKLLKAIAHEEQVFSPNAKDFIQKYNLGTAPSVNRALQSLTEQEHISKIYLNEHTTYFRLNDVFLMFWIQTL